MTLRKTARCVAGLAAVMVLVAGCTDRESTNGYEQGNKEGWEQ